MNPNIRKRFIAVALCVITCLPGLSFGALIDRGGGLIYDTDLNITWLANANYGKGSSFDTSDGSHDGSMTWQNAMAWAENLSYYDSVRGVTYTDWRLPLTLQPDPSCDIQITGGGSLGHTCTGSEMGHLFHNELGGVAGQSLVTTHNNNYNLFSNIWSGSWWSSTEYAPDIECCAWDFNMFTGFQDTTPKLFFRQAWAVRAGDVALVPAPATALLFGSGLLGLVGANRRRQSNI